MYPNESMLLLSQLPCLEKMSSDSCCINGYKNKKNVRLLSFISFRGSISVPWVVKLVVMKSAGSHGLVAGSGQNARSSLCIISMIGISLLSNCVKFEDNGSIETVLRWRQP